MRLLSVLLWTAVVALMFRAVQAVVASDWDTAGRAATVGIVASALGIVVDVARWAAGR